jgi:hypothetical protein
MRACAQGTFFESYWGVGDGGDQGTRHGLILYALYQLSGTLTP